MARAGRKREDNKPANITLQGDHGPQTAAQMAGATIAMIAGDNPNRVAVKRRENVLERMHMEGKLSIAEYQAGMEIQEAYCQCEMLSSGGELKAKVDASPKPDKFIANQVDAQSRLNRAMKGVGQIYRPVVELVCWHNRPIGQLWAGAMFGVQAANLIAGLKGAAKHLRY